MQAFLSNLLVGNAPFISSAVEAAYYAVMLTLIILMGVSALVAIVLIMLQRGNSEGIDALSGSSETYYGKNKGKSIEAKLKMWTMICLIVLAVLAVLFFLLQIEGIWTNPAA